METHWERPAPIQIGIEEANQWVQPSGCTLIGLQAIEEGKANSNYRVLLASGESAFLRIRQRDGSSSSPIEVQPPVNGLEFVPRVLWASEDGRVSLHEWIEGESMARMLAAGRMDQVVSAAEPLGLTLAQIHRHRSDLAGDLGAREPWPNVYDAYFGYVRELTRNDLVLARAETGICDAVNHALDTFDQWARPYFEVPTLTHGDYKASNLILGPKSEVTVVDWEFAHFGSVYLDLGILLRHSEGWPPAFEADLQHGLTEGGIDLPDCWRELARTTDFLSLLDFLSRPGAGPNTVSDVNRLLQRSLAASNR